MLFSLYIAFLKLEPINMKILQNLECRSYIFLQFNELYKQVCEIKYKNYDGSVYIKTDTNLKLFAI